ncbi:EAL domain-containing protein [Oxalicibacterium flavum]|uniref:EAL domain-containing protein n=1 Tax=Oxalicibacterium flavum TaxID=179467 RepID=A0A8J2UL37_9BURK|nr:EAL domain-containing protein [Oxalicibacterium flavum]GGC09995.1 EAL domain-containing protein [Oxalicibacterium flavum]
MTFPALQDYLARLRNAPTDTSLWLDAQGRAHGRYLNSTLTSVFQPIRDLADLHVVGVQGFMRSHSRSDEGLSVWKLLDTVATDDQSIELDRLCRLLHAVNFYRQPELADVDLYLSVHARLLAAVDSNHGMSFRHVLDVLELPHRKIVLQLPVIREDQAWLAHYVADNYRRNGFRLAINVADVRQGLAQFAQILPDVVKVDVRELYDEEAALQLLLEAHASNAHVVFKRVESEAVHEKLKRLQQRAQLPIAVQGYLFDQPRAVFSAPASPQEEAAVPAGTES